MDVVNQQPKAPGFFKNLLAVQAGSTLAGMVAAPVSIPVGLMCSKGIRKLNGSLTKDEVKLLNQAGDIILNNSGLAEKGVKIIREVKIPEIVKMSYSFLEKFVPKKFVKYAKSLNPFYQAKLGKNAFFSSTNEIIQSNKMALSQFHELGHAMNFHNIAGKFGHFLSKLRFSLVANIALGLAASIVASTALFKHKKAEGEKPVGIWDKTTTFIKNNAGKLSALLVLPKVLEEGIATLKGEKALKSLGTVSTDLLKKVKTNNRLGFLSYATVAAVTGLSMMLAVKIKDKIAQPDVK